MKAKGACRRVGRQVKGIITTYPVSPILVIIASGIIRLVVFSNSNIDSNVSAGILSPLAEALFIAGVVALVVDPFIKTRFAKKIGKEMFWVLTNENAPESQRRLVENLAGAKFFYNNSNWTIQAEWADRKKGIISLLTTVDSNCSNYDPRGYVPNTCAYVLASTDDYKSEYLDFKLSGKSTIHLYDHSSPPISKYIDPLDDGSLRLNEKRIVEDFIDSNELPSDGTSISRTTKTYRHARGFFLMSNRTALQKQSFTLNGDAADDLDFSVTLIGTGEVFPLYKGENTDIEMYGIYPFVIMSWHPKFE